MDKLREIYGKIIGKFEKDPISDYAMSDKQNVHTICKSSKFNSKGLKETELMVAVYDNIFAEYYYDQNYFSMKEIDKAVEHLSSKPCYEDGFVAVIGEDWTYTQLGHGTIDENQKMTKEQYEKDKTGLNPVEL